MKWKLAAVVLLLAVGLGTVGFVLFAPGGNAQAQNQFLTAAVSRGNVTQQVVATGSVRSAATYNLAFGSDPVLSTGTGSSSSSASSNAASSGASSSWLVTDVKVAVGDRVAKGDVLAVADTANAKAALDVAKANLAVAKARLAVDKAGLTGAERAAAYDSIRQAQQQLKVARQSQAQTADQNELKLSQAEDALATAQQKLIDDQAAGPADATISADQSAITQAQQQLDTLNLQISGPQSTEAGVTDQQNTAEAATRRRPPWRAPQQTKLVTGSARANPRLLTSSVAQRPTRRPSPRRSRRSTTSNLQVQGAATRQSASRTSRTS